MNYEDLDTIPGWLTRDQAKILYDCALKAPHNRILELGSLAGKSTVLFASAMKERNGLVVSCDRFTENIPFIDYTHYMDDFSIPNCLKVLWNSVHKRELELYVMTIKGEHEKLLGQIDSRFGLAYIDGEHLKERIIGDAIYAWDKLVKGGYIAFHDYGNNDFPDVKLCVDVFKASKNLDVHMSTEGLVVFQK